MSTTLLWLRRDLRLQGLPALVRTIIATRQDHPITFGYPVLHVQRDVASQVGLTLEEAAVLRTLARRLTDVPTPHTDSLPV